MLTFGYFPANIKKFRDVQIIIYIILKGYLNEVKYIAYLENTSGTWKKS